MTMITIQITETESLAVTMMEALTLAALCDMEAQACQQLADVGAEPVAIHEYNVAALTNLARRIREVCIRAEEK